jgi:hypothetical protein
MPKTAPGQQSTIDYTDLHNSNYPELTITVRNGVSASAGKEL